jgi:hypothetical protein
MKKLPSENNGWAEGANKFISGLLNIAQATAKAALVAQAPFFGWPVISGITDAIMDRITLEIFRALATSATFTIIDIQVYSQLKASHEAMAKYFELEDKGEDSDEAYENAKNKLRDLFSWDGSARIP